MSRGAGLDKTQTIGVAMSGGVDSTVAAGLLLEQGFAVEGFFMILPLTGIEEQISKVRRVADRLQIPIHLVDVQEQFRRKIISSFADSYEQGVTPNPCVICNRQIKFGLLMEAMVAQGMDRIATGHYAQIGEDKNQATLCRGADPMKDQSYFLCRLSVEQLEQIVFPLGTWRKKEIFQQAQAMGFTHFDGKESQDVCFLAEQNLTSFLSEHGVESKSGEIVTREGKVLGRHQGIWKYTVGQRRGLGLPDATPWYVIGLNAKKNRVIIGKDEELFRQDVLLSEVCWHIEPPRQWQGRVQLRSRHPAAEAEVVLGKNGNWRVAFQEPQRAVTPGQFAVFYDDGRVVGSGVITADPY